MKGFRTIGVGLCLAIGPAALDYLTGIDWSQHVSSQAAFVISGLLTIAMRCITTTRVGTK